MLPNWRPNSRRARPASCVRRTAAPAHRDPAGRRPHRRHVELRRRPCAGPATRERAPPGRARRHAAVSTTRSTSSSRGHHRLPEGRHADAPQHPEQRLLRRRGDAPDQPDRLCIPVPLYHCFGMVMGNLACMTHGATLVFPAEAFDPLSPLEAVEDERCTALYGVPTMFIAELDHPRVPRRSIFQRCAPASWPASPCPVEVMKRVIDADAYERGDHRLRHDRDQSRCPSHDARSTIRSRSGCRTVGRLLPHVEIKIVDLRAAWCPRGG